MSKTLTDKSGEVKPLDDNELKAFRSASEALPANIKKVLGVRGKQKAPTKEQVTLRLDKEIIEHFKAQGKGWQTRLNDALLEHIEP